MKGADTQSKAIETVLLYN